MSTRELVRDHVTIRRIRDIAQKCSDRLYAGDDIPLEEIEVISVVIEEFVDAFHHDKEEKAYFPANERKNDRYAEEVRKFTIEHEFGRRVASMMLRNLKGWKSGTADGREPVARFLKTYAAFVTDHTGKEEKFFEMVEEAKSLSDEEDRQILRHYEACRSDIGGSAKVQELLRLVEYLEDREWMKR
ncbi:MAG TPA: hemerythrin domain-containing protein [Nitrososphaera sp.]|nr:hemerythrin domain-containing protein [Nitrososphaera sp.]